MDSIRWGLIGTGAIARAFAGSLGMTDSGFAAAVASRTQSKADAFATEFDIPTRYETYDALLEDPSIDAVYVSTPHPFHAYWAIRAAEAGKHVLCEKPLGINHGQGMAMIEAARENGVFFMEAFMYRCHPQTAKLIELLQEGAVGEVRLIRASFGFGGGTEINPSSRLMDVNLGGGGILDVGCYPVSISRLIAGIATGKPFAEPVKVDASGRIGETGVDEWTAAVLTFEHDIIAQVSTSIRVSPDNRLEIYGSDGSIIVGNPWVANRIAPEQGSIELVRAGKTFDIPADRTSFAYEADAVALAIGSGNREVAWPGMTWNDTLGNLSTLDAWRRAIGLEYDLETPKANVPVRGALRKRPDAVMQYGRIEGLDKPVSKLIMGCDNQMTFAHGAAIWDDWFERGGNAFDTSWVYGGGLMEKLLGAWIGKRGIRDEVVVTVKGAHTPRCLPDLLVEDFMVSLDRLKFEYADIYVMHRDNPEVPVGEFVDVLDDLISRGLIRGVLGGSNWSISRFEALNAYANQHGKQGFAVMNNNLSLARMVKPVWAGCVHISDVESRSWLEKTGTTNFSWSSQARGYFLPEHERLKLGADNFSCWDAPDNRERRKRAEELAGKKGCSPINIAAAYVLNQPFPSFALVGPRLIHETATIMPAFDVELSPREISWLWGE